MMWVFGPTFQFNGLSFCCKPPNKMHTSISMIMETKKQINSESLELLKNPFFVMILIIGSPFYLTHKIVQWASMKSDKHNKQIKITVG
jgi:hypothetical protein